MIRLVLPFVLALAVHPSLAADFPTSSTSPSPVLDRIASLKAGEFLWMPKIAPEGPMLVIVNLRTQRLVAYRNGVPIGVSTVSTGKPSTPTPTGIYTILQKRVEHYSSKYDAAPMPYMQRLTWAGVAMHGGTLPGYPASHGCIRLPKAFAPLLYDETRVGMTVIVTDSAQLPPLAPSEAPAFTDRPSGGGETQGFWWQPELSPSGPVTIVISGADRQLQVLRDGKLIGRAAIAFDPPIRRLTAYSLVRRADSQQQWTRVNIDPATPPYAPQVQIDAAVRQTIESILVPGTTLILVPDSLRHDAGTTLPVLESEDSELH